MEEKRDKVRSLLKNSFLLLFLLTVSLSFVSASNIIAQDGQMSLANLTINSIGDTNEPFRILDAIGDVIFSVTDGGNNLINFDDSLEFRHSGNAIIMSHLPDAGDLYIRGIDTDDTGASGGAVRINDLGGNVYVGDNSAFFVNGTNGNVGFGLSKPDAKLEVNLTSSKFKLNETKFSILGNPSGSAPTFHLGHTGNDPDYGYANMIIGDTSGNTGAWSTIQITGGTGLGRSRLLLGDRDDYDIGAIEYYHTDNSFHIKTNNVDSFILDSSGNLNVSGNLYVEGCITYNGNTTLGTCI